MTYATVHSCTLAGIAALPVEVEVHVSGGLPSMSIVGLPQSAVRESKDRVRAAVQHAGFRFPQSRIIVNLAPADLPKRGGRFDLPIALGILMASCQLPAASVATLVVVGELGLTGELRAVTGVLPTAYALAGTNKTLLIPLQNYREATRSQHTRVHGVATLEETCRLLKQNPLSEIIPDSCHLIRTDDSAGLRLSDGVSPNSACWRRPSPGNSSTTCPDTDEPQDESTHGSDMSDVVGQAMARRALEIAAAGRHNLLMIGPPGTGKSMLASRLPGIQPPMSEQEAMETASVASISHTGFDEQQWGVRPFRSPHHTCTGIALVGGGSQPMPGEISLAHNGVLFLDELSEFPRRVLDVLREPMETGTITVSRAARQANFPARFQLVAAMNPCPCGYDGDAATACRCTPDAIARYHSRLSGPFLDRIDLRVTVGRLSLAERNGSGQAESSTDIRLRVRVAHEHQIARQECVNAGLSIQRLRHVLGLNRAGQALLDTAVERYELSLRATHRLLRVARTIADLAETESVSDAHLAEALSLRADKVFG